MKTKQFILAAICCMTLISTTQLFAQRKEKSAEELSKQSVEQLDEKLDLSDEQETKVYDITLKYMKKAQELRSSDASRQDKMKTYQADNSAKEKEMKEILSEEQFEEWQKIEEEKREKMKQNRRK